MESIYLYIIGNEKRVPYICIQFQIVPDKKKKCQSLYVNTKFYFEEGQQQARLRDAPVRAYIWNRKVLYKIVYWSVLLPSRSDI